MIGVDVIPKVNISARQSRPATGWVYCIYRQRMRIVQGSFLTLPLGVGIYDYVISVMSLHHVTFEAKLGLYRRIHLALRDGGTYIEGDYIVSRVTTLYPRMSMDVEIPKYRSSDFDACRDLCRQFDELLRTDILDHRACKDPDFPYKSIGWDRGKGGFGWPRNF